MDKGLIGPRWYCSLVKNTPKCPYIFWPNLSAQAQKFRIFDKKALSGCPSVLLSIFLLIAAYDCSLTLEGISKVSLIVSKKNLGITTFPCYHNQNL